MFTLTINASTPEEFKERVKGLFDLFPNEGKPISTKPEQKTKTPAAGSPAVVATPAPDTAAAGSITITQVRETVQAITTGNVANRDKVKAILGEYGAESVKTLDPQHFANFLTKVKAIA